MIKTYMIVDGEVIPQNYIQLGSIISVDAVDEEVIDTVVYLKVAQFHAIDRRAKTHGCDYISDEDSYIYVKEKDIEDV